MKLMEKILSKENLEIAIKKVKQNKGAPGIDKMTVQEIEYWFEQYQEELISKIMNKQYRPMPVKRVPLTNIEEIEKFCNRFRIVRTRSSSDYDRILLRPVPA